MIREYGAVVEAEENQRNSKGNLPQCPVSILIS
jgi:hypothetical protein